MRKSLLLISCIVVIGCAPSLQLPQVNKNEVDKEVSYQQNMAKIKEKAQTHDNRTHKE